MEGYLGRLGLTGEVHRFHQGHWWGDRMRVFGRGYGVSLPGRIDKLDRSLIIRMTERVEMIEIALVSAWANNEVEMKPFDLSIRINASNNK